MGHLKIEKNAGGIQGLCIIEPEVRRDERGYFMETYNLRDMEAQGLFYSFVQDNQSSGKRGTLRGLHFQKQYPQDKLVRVISGEVYDVAVDLREGSETFGKYFGIVLSAENKKQFLVPGGFAHGFMVLSEYAEFCYKVTDFYHPEDEGGIMFDDPDIDVSWPFSDLIVKDKLILSEKDRRNESFRDYCEERGIFV